MFSIIGWIICLTLLAVLVVDAVHSYRTSDGQWRQKLLAVGKQSAVIAAARIGAIGGLVLDMVVEIANVVASPEIGTLITNNISGKAVGYTIVAAALIAEAARRRSLRTSAGVPVPLLGPVRPDGG
jgi:hypothetical protein